MTLTTIVMTRFLAISIVALVTVYAPSSFGQIIYVDASAGGSDNGTSWTDAFVTLQDALSAATSGDTIWVADGTYYPDESNGGATNTNDRTASFQLISGVVLYGGFAGGETSVSQRDPLTNVSTLSGDIDKSDVNDQGNNSFHVVVGSGADGTAVLDGFLITDGYAHDEGGANPDNEFGGGIYVAFGSPTISGNTFSENIAWGGGSGIFVFSGHGMVISRNTFVSNGADITGSRGGGIYIKGSGGNIQSDVQLVSNTFSLNRAEAGGGILTEFSGVTIVGNTLIDNTGVLGAGITASDIGETVIINTIIHETFGASLRPSLDPSATMDVSFSLINGPFPTDATDGGNNIITGDAMVGLIDDNGGPTETRLPSPFSLAVDAGSCAGQTIDQRGELRPFDAPINPNAGDGCDIGAVELQTGEVFVPDCNGVCFVDASASGTSDGTSWTDAFLTVQDALLGSASGDTIWVADGTYYPDEQVAGFVNTDLRSASFEPPPGVVMYGGFAGGETSVAQRDPSTNPTTLSGDLTQNDGPNFANNADNSYHVIDGSGSNSLTIIDGFVITAGNANGADSLANGGGIFSQPGNPTITNNTITLNHANFQGGGIYTIPDFSQTITENTISDNVANSSPGGVLIAASSGIVARNTIVGNTGGGLRSVGFQFITANTITDNTGFRGAGIFISDNASIKGNTIVGNTASTDGGGLYHRLTTQSQPGTSFMQTPIRPV